MKIRTFIGIALIGPGSPVVASQAAMSSIEERNRGVEPADMLQWGVGMVIVLALFFGCVWAMRRLTALTPGSAGKLRVLGGVSVGVRERIVLVEAGKKQLVVGVAPGRIETLLVLEGDDCLPQQENRVQDGGHLFAQKLMQVMKGQGH